LVQTINLNKLGIEKVDYGSDKDYYRDVSIGRNVGQMGYDIDTHFILINDESIVLYRGGNGADGHVVRLYRIDLASLQASHVDLASSYNYSYAGSRDSEGLCQQIGKDSFVCLAEKKLVVFDDKLNQLSQLDVPVASFNGLQVMGPNEVLIRSEQSLWATYRWWNLSEPLTSARTLGPVDDYEDLPADGIGDLLIAWQFGHLVVLNGEKAGATICDDAICGGAVSQLLIPTTQDLFLANAWGLELMHPDLTLTKLSAPSERCDLYSNAAVSLTSPRFAVDIACKVQRRANSGLNTGRSGVRVYDSTTGRVISQFLLKDQLGWQLCMNAEGTKLAVSDDREIRIFAIDSAGQK
jgi:hypothetical protein